MSGCPLGETGLRDGARTNERVQNRYRMYRVPMNAAVRQVTENQDANSDYIFYRRQSLTRAPVILDSGNSGSRPVRFLQPQERRNSEQLPSVLIIGRIGTHFHRHAVAI